MKSAKKSNLRTKQNQTKLNQHIMGDDFRMSKFVTLTPGAAALG